MNELWTIIHNKMKRVKYVTAHAQKFSDITICILVYTMVYVSLIRTFHLSKLFFGNLSNGVQITEDALYNCSVL